MDSQAWIGQHDSTIYLKETRGLALSWLGPKASLCLSSSSITFLPPRVLLLLGGLSCPAFAGLPINFPFPTLELGARFLLQLLL